MRVSIYVQYQVQTHTYIYTHIHTGNYDDEQEAAKAVDEFLKEHFINPPNLNFLPDGT
jgi:hypothetical protein